MEQRQWLTDQFEQHRPHLRAVAYRMLGSVSETDDAVQEAWLRVRDQDGGTVENMRAWLTAVVGRVCLNMLRSRRTRREELSAHVPDPVVSWGEGDPEHQGLLADSVGLALLVVLEELTPAERLAFVLHDVFAVPFADIAATLDRSEAAAQQLASRARRRLRNSPEPDADLARQRRVIDAFFAASRDGDFDALLEVLDPDVQLRIDGGTLRADASLVRRGAEAVAAHTVTYSKLYPFIRPALVNGAAGAVVAPHGQVFSVMAFTVTNGKIANIDSLVDPERLARLDLNLSPIADEDADDDRSLDPRRA
ncbi:RNA polymerase sigma factor SigJ [Kribbella sp. VKM Ac-2568]|uniref:RNA polymerase sigma factor SigJ n=1 Tax=Kribbella sp. VKM Ac-2568 TaxID=2512219 RepID=UPI00104C1B69|nr:RNA polymerase sigma factor SigJ [Kribbella sp. VKM Ac-2568]TCM35278.1 RNA polymerase sigma-70 factor (ECF subfamily) [Kribbella sp. VKM Ac-2568]